MTQQDNQLNIFGEEIDDLMPEERVEEQVNMINASGQISDKPKKSEKDETDMSYEEAVARLEQVVARLESGDAALDESMELFQQGMKLTDYCSKKLNSMEEKISKLMMQADGTLVELPLDEAESGKV